MENLLLNFFYTLIFVENKKKKILVKVSMCNCHAEKIHSEDNEYVKKLTHLHCKCREKHLLYILFCHRNPHGAIPILELQRKYTCATEFALDVRDFCIRVKYLLNFKCYKFCLKKIPVSIQDKLQTTRQYFNETQECETFFAFNKQKNTIDVLLDNPTGLKIIT